MTPKLLQPEERFGRLVVLGEAERIGTSMWQRGQTAWRCRCDCGKEVTVVRAALVKGTTKSCGCSRRRYHPRRPQRDKRQQRDDRTPTMRSWMAMRQRCFNPNGPEYHRYGGRGITVCDRWRESFAAFLSDMGEKPPGRSLDRIDNDGNYEPGNCRWATPTTQSRNSRHAKLTEQSAAEIRRRHASGESTKALAAEFGVGKDAVWCVVTGRTWKLTPSTGS